MQQGRWAAAAAEEHATMVLASALSKPRATVTMLVSALARTAREDMSNARDVRWQQWQGDRIIVVAGGGGSGMDMTSVNEARARGGWRRTSTGKARVMQRWHHDRTDKGEGKWLGKGAARQ